MDSEDAQDTLSEVARPGEGADDEGHVVSLRRLPPTSDTKRVPAAQRLWLRVRVRLH